jgi:hypothetical protein
VTQFVLVHLQLREHIFYSQQFGLDFGEAREQEGYTLCSGFVEHWTSAAKSSALRRFVRAVDLSVQEDKCDHWHRNSFLAVAMVTPKGYPAANRRQVWRH